MTSLAPPHVGLPDDSDDDSGGYSPRRRGIAALRERGRDWWRETGMPRDGRKPSLRERMVPSFAREPWWVSWGFPLLVTIAGGVMRFWNLGKPKTVVFDETYYAKDAWAVIHFGHERGWLVDPSVGMANDDHKIIANPDIWRSLLDPNHIGGNAVHPPVGKWLIGAGEAMFGFTPYGWRFMPAVFGTLAILMTARIARRLFRSTLAGCLAGLFLAFDGMEFVMSRTALLDIFVMFWTLAAFGCLLVDRDKMRTRLVDWRESLPPTPLPDDTRGPKLGWRWWRTAGAVCIGLDLGTKWSGVMVIFCFLALTWLWDHGAYKAVGIRRHWALFFRRTWHPIVLGVLAVLVYMATWTGWFVTKDGNYRQWAAEHNAIHVRFLSALRSWWQYHWDTFNFHTNLDSPHAYMSNPWSWLVMGRPTDFYYCSQGNEGCPPLGKDDHQQVLALGTPQLWWLATIAMIWCVWRWLGRKDWRAGAILNGFIAGWAFWLHYQHRTIFTFYAVAFAPFMCLAAAYLLSVIMGRADAPPTRRAWGAITSGAITVYILIMFIYFYPIFSAETITYNQWLSRMWWPSWI